MNILKLAALLLASSMALAEVPQLINYQGMLTDAQGNPKPGTANLSFTIYDSASGTNVLWGPQTFSNVPLINGSFNIILGTTDTNGAPIANAFQTENSFLQITDTGLLASTSDDTVISPRQQILSAPYTIHAKEADHAKDADHALEADHAKVAEVWGPIGTIVAWHKSQTYVTLPEGWIELNPNTVVNDSDSPFNGMTLPNLNGQVYANGRGRYLRGGTTSGLMNESTYYTDNGGPATGPAGTFYGYSGGNYVDLDYINGTLASYSTSKLGANRRFQTAAMTVVWIMRIK